MGIETAFVTGATGLLGNNLVKMLAERGVRVKALARSPEKGAKQFSGVQNVEVISGDMQQVERFASALVGCDVVFHTAAFFRDSYTGGSHWDELKRINVDGVSALLDAAYRSGVRRFVQTSSIAVLDGKPGAVIDESCDRDPADADDYYRSKILADEAVRRFLAAHPDFDAKFVLPGWMWGPGDIGPTSSGQLALDAVLGKLPGLVPFTFSLVDARDVAQAEIAAAEHGRRGERYLAAGRHMTMHELVPLIGQVAGIKTPSRSIPLPMLYLIAGLQEVYARISGKPVLLSLATVRLMAREADRTRFSHAKTERELGIKFRPVRETVADTITWYRANGWLPSTSAAPALRAA